ncbi:3-oxoacyl-ACP synthase III family protein [Pedobacter insulae]|uniref:3-oxoacyl-[acyl-carrier-protein] synthase-3 n=1 Tax=Pedobacter insulae TaxID=414048 RepID=A0A1I2YSJ6_9SPHI|nr:ketoacyl-ACP synthase III [Pedobacter insulae]SFH28239.1 3-oxoacyl-[acyl-carrier-protein] synthase-3 [Pedobacter insulae]
MGAYIHGVSYYLPDHVLDNDQLNRLFPEWSADKISSKTGIYQRRIAGKDEFTSDMAILAAEKLFLEYNIDRNEIDFILLCTQSPDYFLPTTACIVQDRLKIPTSAGALDFNLGCSGYVYGLSLAKGLIAARIATNILLITSETYSKFINDKDKGNRTLFADAAAATLITAKESLCEIGDFVLGTDGSGAENLIVKNGASRNRELSGEDLLQDDGSFRNDNNLYMNGGEIFSFTAKAVPLMVNEVLSKSKLTLPEVDLFIFHQANAFMLNFIRKKIGIPEDKFFLYLENCGNTVSSTIPIALKEALAAKRIDTDAKVLLAGFGVGYSWGATVLHFK